MKTTTTIAKFSAAGLATAGLVFGAVGIAGAQDADTDADTDTDTTTEEAVEREQGHRGSKRNGKKLLIAEILDITPEELSEQREAGATLAEIAGDQVDEVIDAIIDNIEERIDARVESGRITQEQADERLAELEERVTERVETGVRGDGEGREGRRGFRPGNRGAGADANAQETGLSLS